MRPYSSRTGAEPGARSASGFSSLRASVNRSRSNARDALRSRSPSFGTCDGPAISSSSAALGAGARSRCAPSTRRRLAPRDRRRSPRRGCRRRRAPMFRCDARRRAGPAASRNASEAPAGRSSLQPPGAAPSNASPSLRPRSIVIRFRAGGRRLRSGLRGRFDAGRLAAPRPGVRRGGAMVGSVPAVRRRRERPPSPGTRRRRTRPRIHRAGAGTSRRVGIDDDFRADERDVLAAGCGTVQPARAPARSSPSRSRRRR